MLKKFISGFLISSAFIVGVLTIIDTSYTPPSPVFWVKNDSNDLIQVVASWREENLKFELQPNQSFEFTVNDEASMEFVATFPDGKNLSGKLGYFTSGTEAKVIINDTKFKISSELSGT